MKNERVALEGRHVRIVPLDAASHAAGLYNGSKDPSLWRYLFNGPYTDEAEFRAWLDGREKSEDPLFFTILDRTADTPAGYCSLMRIEPAHRVIEVGNILYLPQLQRTAAATEAMYLMARYVFEDSGTVATSGNAIRIIHRREERHCAWDSRSRGFSGST